MISDGFEWSWFPVKPFEKYMKYLWELSRSYTTYNFVVDKIVCWNRAKNKLAAGIEDLEVHLEIIFLVIETNILFGWRDIDVCLWMISVQSSIISEFFFYTFLMVHAHWWIGITLRYVYTQ